jgi:hypothetical protein
METKTFLTCLAYNGISTGAMDSLEGVFSFASGDSKIIYNLLYPTGYDYTGAQIFGPSLPLINVSSKTLVSNTFSGENVYRVGYEHTGSFSLIMDVEYDGVTRANYWGVDNILLSTIDNPNGLNSGFAIGINDANRLFFRASGYQKTLSKELSKHDFVQVSLVGNQFVDFGIYNLGDDKYYSSNVRLPSSTLDTRNIYVGGYLNNTSSSNTGYYGKINTAILFNDSRSNSEIDICANCSLMTGYSIAPQTYDFSGIQITGMSFSGVYQTSTLSTAYVTGLVTKRDGTTVNVIYPSGVTGLTSIEEVAIPLLSNVALQATRNAYSFGYGYQYLSGFADFSLEFDYPLTSGDIVEVYDYQLNNPYVNKSVDGLIFPADPRVVQLIGNGLQETSGVDYQLFNEEILGYDEDYLLMYDSLATPTINTAYSGYWQTSRIPMSGGVYFPTTSQYLEPVGVSGGTVLITGMSGVSTSNPFYPNFGYDIYMNGQKLVSGTQYDVLSSGAGFVVALSGANLPSFYATSLYHPTGGLPTGISEINVPELAFTPQFNGFGQSIFFVTGDQKTITGLNGFSEQVWVNGVRQMASADYIRHEPNEYSNGTFDFPNYSLFLYDTVQSRIHPWDSPDSYGVIFTAMAGVSAPVDSSAADWVGTISQNFDATNYLVLGNATNAIGFTLKGTGSLNINWGDGTTDSYTLSSTAQDISHSYSTAQLRTVVLIGDITSIVSAGGANIGDGITRTDFGPQSADFGGNISTLKNLQHIEVWGNNTLGGSVSGLTSLNYFDVDGLNTVYGDISCLYGVIYVWAGGYNQLFGLVNDLTNLTYLFAEGYNKIYGIVPNFQDMTFAYFKYTDSIYALEGYSDAAVIDFEAIEAGDTGVRSIYFMW